MRAPDDRGHERRSRHVASDHERKGDDRGDGQTLDAVRPSLAWTVIRRRDNRGLGAHRHRHRGRLRRRDGARDRGAQFREAGAVLHDGIGQQDQLRRESLPARREQNDLRPRGDTADLGDHGWVVIEGELLVQNDEVGLELLDLQQDVRHRCRFPDDEESSLLEEEAREPALERPAVSDDRGASRCPSCHFPAPPCGLIPFIAHQRPRRRHPEVSRANSYGGA